MGDVTQILSAIESGEPHAVDELLPLVYDELRKLAAAKLAHEKPGQTLQATALVHEAWLKLAGGEQAWETRRHFFSVAAKAMRQERLEGYAAGADDYIVKPFSPRELCARIRNRLRISSKSNTETLSINGVVLDQVSYRTSVNGNPVELGPTEFRLLRHFMNNTERVFTRSQLLDRVWGTNIYIEERTVDVHIRRLRKALEPYQKSDLIQTVRGAGYRFSAQNP